MTLRPWHFLGRLRGRATTLDPRSILSRRKWRLLLRDLSNDYRRFRREAKWPPFDSYVLNNTIRPHVRELLEAAVGQFAYKPKLTVIMPVYNVDARWLKVAIESVQTQIYPHWELCIADDASTKPETAGTLKNFEGDSRIRTVYRQENGQICNTCNDAATLATGDFVVLMDHDDHLAPHALFEIARLLQVHPQADVIYSDEDKIDPQGRRYDPYFKPDWSPTLFLGYNYINHLTCIRRTLFEEVGRFRPGYEGAQNYDLLLRIVEKTNRIFHIPKILYHCRAPLESIASAAEAKPIVKKSADAALADFLKRQGINADAYQPELARRHRLPINQLDWPDHGPSVTIIIPTHNQYDILRKCIDSIQKTTYRNYELLVVDNESDCPRTLAYLDHLSQSAVRVVRIFNDGMPFSFSRVNNKAAALSTAEYLLFLNNDTEVLEARWLSRLVGYAQLPGVGVTGARLLYPNGSIQHAGIILNLNAAAISAPGHAFRHHSKDQPSYLFLAETARECSAVTAACLLTPRRLFLDVGGFQEDPYKVTLNDVDYCLRLSDEGLRSIYVADSILMHHERRSRDPEDDPRELASFRQTYRSRRDTYYNPNLSRQHQHPFTVSPECTLDYLPFLGRPLKVACFVHNLNREGGPKVLVEAAIGLKARDGVQPAVVSFQDGPARNELDREGIPCRILSLDGTENVLGDWQRLADYERSVNTVREFLLRERPDVVMAMTLQNFLVVEAAAGVSIPAVWLIQESAEALARTIPPFLLQRCETSFERAAWGVFGSRETQSMYERYNPGHNSTVVYNSLRADRIDRILHTLGKDTARNSLGVPAGKKVILSVGTICPRKDQETLIKAVAALTRKRNDVRVYLVGARRDDPHVRPYLRSVRRLIDRFDLADTVELVPETPDTFRYYRAADVFVFSSLIESFSFVILEAMVYGLPIVTTPCCGVGEQVRFGVNARSFDFGDANTCAAHLRSLLDDSNLREEMGRNSRNIVQSMQTFHEMAERYERLVVSAWQNRR